MLETYPHNTPANPLAIRWIFGTTTYSVWDDPNIWITGVVILAARQHVFAALVEGLELRCHMRDLDAIVIGALLQLCKVRNGSDQLLEMLCVHGELYNE